MNQAQALRKLAQREANRAKEGAGPLIRTFTVTSGKGGVGKTSVVVNVGLCLADQGKKVLLIDADLGLANVDVILGINPQYNLHDVVTGRKTIEEVLVTGPHGLMILPAASGVAEMARLSDKEKLALITALDNFQTDADVVLIDTAAGIGDNVLYFNLAVQERIVVATDEPTSLTDAYALIKVLYQNHDVKRFKLLVNNVKDLYEAKEVYKKLSQVLDRFLGGPALEFMGFVPSDPAVKRAVQRQVPVVESFPDSPAAVSFYELARALMRGKIDPDYGNIKFFWRRLVQLS